MKAQPEVPYLDGHLEMSDNSSRSSASPTTKHLSVLFKRKNKECDPKHLKSLRDRSATLKDLSLDIIEGLKPEEVIGIDLSKTAYVRRWKDRRGCSFYDCSCGTRRPTHDRLSIVRHIQRIHHQPISDKPSFQEQKMSSPHNNSFQSDE
jgi:hypothetical protein